MNTEFPKGYPYKDIVQNLCKEFLQRYIAKSSCKESLPILADLEKKAIYYLYLERKDVVLSLHSREATTKTSPPLCGSFILQRFMLTQQRQACSIRCVPNKQTEDYHASRDKRCFD